MDDDQVSSVEAEQLLLEGMLAELCSVNQDTSLITRHIDSLLGECNPHRYNALFQLFDRMIMTCVESSTLAEKLWTRWSFDDRLERINTAIAMKRLLFIHGKILNVWYGTSQVCA